MLHVHRAERADALAGALAGLLATPPSDPFASEIVAVPARGIERWLTQQLSAVLGVTPSPPTRADGICAGIEFPSPAELVAGAIATASGITAEADPWRPERLVWPLLEVLEASLDEPWAAALATHLGHGAAQPDPYRAARRLGTVRHLAALLDSYARHRPELVSAWTTGERDGAPSASPSSAFWQAELWRRLRERIDVPDPAQRLAGACERLRENPALVSLPERVFLFGLTRLPATHVEILRALGTGRELHLFVLHPSPALWGEVAAKLRTAPAHSHRRTDDATAELPSNPLLRSWGRDARELQLVLAGDGFIDHHHALSEGGEPQTLLERIQADVRADSRPPGAPFPGARELRPALDPGDRSIEIHACHGHARQVEVIRDAILHALAEDPELEPREVIVMCPDIETFAPLIQATFGTESEETVNGLGGGPGLRVRLADRSLRQTNPILATVSELLELADGRVTASEVLDFADREPVRRRFRFDDDDLGRLQQWIADAGIRWGLDPAHRAPFKLEQVAGGTWAAGLDRVLLGVAMTEDDDRCYGDVLPLDDVDSGAIDLAGRFAELIARLRAAVDSLCNPQPIAAWVSALGRAADALMLASGRDSYQRSQLQRLLDALLEEAADASTPVALPEIRSLLSDRLKGRPTRANFRTGSLTICTLVPMRSVPHRVVCLLGLDDGAFPRKAPHDGDDVMLEAPEVGERDARSEDRQLLLDALLAARERLIITYNGGDERTNTVKPAAVPVGELLDVIGATVRPPARERVLIKHPLQPFDPRNFTSGELIPAAAWGFDKVTLEGAQALLAPRSHRPEFLPAPLPLLEGSAYELEDLIRFAQHPTRSFLRRRLQVGLADWSEEIADALSVELDGLERWDVGERLLDALLAGVDERAAWLAEIRRGTLPPGELGKPILLDAFATAKAIAGAAREQLDGELALGALDVHVTVPGDRTLTGTVPGVSGETLIAATFSRLAAKHRITAWVRLLALTAADPEREWQAVTVGRGRGDAIAVQRIRPLGEDPSTRATVSAEKLIALLDLFDRGMREPLPIFAKTSAAYALATARGGDPAKAARSEWETDWRFAKEDAEPEHQLALGGVLTLDEVLAAAPAGDEFGAGWDPSEGTRFGRLACRMWDGLLEFEELTSL
jgi:exodeoxyribonuclease V gamma subunit